MKRKTTTLLVWICMLCATALTAQLDSLQVQRIDSLFSAWNQPNHPGGAVGIVKDGQLVFSRAYGLASMEYLVPNTPGTVFNTGSVSKQLTAMGIVRLEEAGKLSFDDDIHRFLPELPDFGKPITIRHLMHHTSGLRSLHALFELAGWREDDARTNEDLNRIILGQRDLNFEPGSEYLYCNTGYMLMATIIEKITGDSFRSWMDQNVFDPLGMTDTYVEDAYDRVVANNATSYYRRDDDFFRAVEYWGYVGSGNAHSTTDDLLKWLLNFETPQPGWETSFAKLQTLDPFNDGTPNNYAFGVVVDEHLGQRRVSHGGAIGGFRAFVGSYPEARLHIAVLTNFSGGNPGGKTAAIATALLGATQPSDQPEAKTIAMAPGEMTQFEGTYWNPREKFRREIRIDKDTLRYVRSETNQSPLLPLAKNTFAMAGAGSDVRVVFEGSGDDRTMVFSQDGTPASRFESVPADAMAPGEFQTYTGTYYSPELQTSYTLHSEGEEIYLYHIRHGKIPLEPLFKDVFSGSWPVGVLEVKRTPQGAVAGIRVSNGRVRNAWFERR